MNLNNLSIEQKEKYYEALCEMISPNRISLFEKIITERTDHLCVVVENIYQPQNASAVLRTCECLGVQQVHVIENENEYRLNPDVALGSSYWIDMHRYNRKDNNTEDCLSKLKSQGYKIVATLPAEKDVSLPEININQPLAIVFGNEKEGLSETTKNMADICMKIPMYGFTESYNISVSAAITMYTLTEKMRHAQINYQLSEERRLNTLIKWAKHSIRRSDIVEKEILKRLFNIE
ncbi:MAG: RNA methyltransferase [Bacteroidales bacterium]|nr:RNA methyltransferase [Bacteroidales bacterium]